MYFVRVRPSFITFRRVCVYVMLFIYVVRSLLFSYMFMLVVALFRPFVRSVVISFRRAFFLYFFSYLGLCPC